MKKEAIATAKTIEDAVKNACEEMQVSQDKVSVEVLEYPKKGFLGLGSALAKVRVSYEEEEDPAASEEKFQVQGDTQTANSQAAKAKVAKAQAALDFLEELFRQMGLSDVEAVIDSQDEHSASIILSGSDVGVVIGRRGETMDAIQYLTGLVANRMEGEYFRISLDSGGYREKRAKTLEELAIRLAKNAVKTGKSSTLEPMNPYERRIIHSTVQTVEGASSHSVGEEPNRRVVITCTNPPKRRSSSRSDRGGRGDSGPRRGGRSSKPVAGYRKPYGGRTQYAPDNVKEDGDSYQEDYQETSTPIEKTAVELESGGLYGKIEL